MTRFVGRADELQRLDQLLSAASTGSARTLIVGGEAGVGKTRLLREFLSRVETATVLLGGCGDDVEGAGPPFAPFVQALRRLYDELEPTRRDQLFASGRSELSRLVPEFGEAQDHGLVELG